jgi:hypothetical protein
MPRRRPANPGYLGPGHGQHRPQEIPRFSRQARRERAVHGLPFWATPPRGSRRSRRPEPAIAAVAGFHAHLLAQQFGIQLTPEQIAQLQPPRRRALVAAGGFTAQSRSGRRAGWRFRNHLQPFLWLAGVLALGAGLHIAPHRALCGVAAAVVVPAVLYGAATRKTQDGSPAAGVWVRRFMVAQAVFTAVWLPVLAVAGPGVAVWVLLSGAPFLGLWVRHWAWRPQTVTAATPAPVDGDRATWQALAGQQKWQARLGPARSLPGGGRRYPVQCDGVRTVIRDVLGKPDNVAGAWHRTIAECYAERDPKGVTSRGYLTILDGASLQATRYWAGQGMDANGLVTVGRFADGADAREKWYTPRYGPSHDLVSGTTGSGKSELLNLKVFLALASGVFVPVILDPQEGQSLPFWRDRCLYASGVDAVERYLRGLHAAFLDRSGRLSTWRWTDNGTEMPGMPFFDLELTGLLMPYLILDEAHMVLKGDTKWQRGITAIVVELARLIRKAGGKFTLATQVPGLTEMGGQQALRDMLRGGNVWSGRTANKVAGGMLGLVKDPSEIPRYFGDGSPTAGLSYCDGPDNRPDAPMRTDRIPQEAYASPPPVPRLDDRFLEVMDRAMRAAVSPTSTVALPVPAPRPEAGGGLAALGRPKLQLVPALPDSEDAAGRRCVDAVAAVLSAAPGPVDRGVIIQEAARLSAEWGRPKPWTIRAVTLALRDLVDSGRAIQPAGKGSAYQAVPSR